MSKEKEKPVGRPASFLEVHPPPSALKRVFRVEPQNHWLKKEG